MKKLILILIVLASVPLFAADPYIPTDHERANWTWSDMRTIATCIEAYATDHQKYPEAKTMEELKALVQPIYVISLPMHDAWGHPYRIQSGGTSYRIISAGADGVFDETTWSVAAKDLPLTADGVYENGKMTRRWTFKQ